jgi:hypothetical protein
MSYASVNFDAASCGAVTAKVLSVSGAQFASYFRDTG